MARRFHLLVIAAILIAIGATAFAQKPGDQNNGPPPLPSMDDLREMYDAGDYRAAVQQIARVLRLKGAPAQAYDREALLLLRGQSLLAMEDPRAAKRALEEAQKSAQNDIAMKAHGLVALIDRSKLTTYKKRSGDKAEINIADPKSLPAALSALLDDELPGFQNDAANATRADNLAPSIALIPKLLDLAAVEFLATGKYERVGEIAKSIGEHARELTEHELTTQDQKITATESLANQLIDTGGYLGTGAQRRWWWTTGVTRRGLVSDERENLYQTIQYLTRIEDTAKHAQKVAKAIDGNVDAWNAVVEHAAQVKSHAQSVLEAEGVRTATDTSNR